MYKLLIILLPFVIGASACKEIVEVEKQVIVEKVVDKQTLINKQSVIEPIKSKQFNGKYIEQDLFMVVVDGVLIAIHTEEEYAQIHRQYLINKGENAIIYKQTGEMARFNK